MYQKVKTLMAETAKTALTIVIDAMAKRRYAESESFGERLQRLRKAKGFTQRELATAVGTSQRMIAYYETQSGTPAAPVLLKLAETLGTDANELIGLEKPKRSKADASAPEDIRLWRKLRQVETLSATDRRQVLQFIEALVERNALKREKSS